MRFITLSWHNLASYGAETVRLEFDHTPLSEASLIAIVGNTGAGKSTILDALCLALYGNAPRFLYAKKAADLKLEDPATPVAAPDDPDDPRAILNKQAQEGSAELVFDHADGQRYKASWSVRRKRTGGFDHASNVVEVWDSATGQWHERLRCRNLHNPQPWKTADGQALLLLLGLDMGQFMRTIVLAQNDFASFLHSPDDAKAELLEKVTGTQIYTRIAERILIERQEARKAYEDSTRARALRESQCLSEAALAETRQHLSALEAERAQLEAQQKGLEGQLQWLSQGAELTARKQQQEAELATATQTLGDLKPVEQEQEQWDRVQPIAPSHHTVGECQSRHQQLTAAAQESAAKLAELQALTPRLTEQAEAAKQRLEQAQLELDKLTPIIRKARDLDKDLSAICQEGNRVKKELDAATKDKDAKLQAREATERQIRTLDEQLRRSENNLTMMVLAEAQEHLREGEPCPLCGAVHHDLAQAAHAHSGSATDKQNALNLIKEREKQQGILGQRVAAIEEAEQLRSAKSTEREAKLEEYKSRRSERDALGLTEPPDALETRLNRAQRTAQQQHDQAREALSRHAINVEGARAAKEHADKAVADNQQQLAEAQGRIDQWLSTEGGGLSTDDLRRLLAPGINRGEQRRKLQAAQQRLVAAQTALEATRRDVEQHAKAAAATTLNQTDLERQLQETTARRKQADEDLMPLGVTLRNHDEATHFLADNQAQHEQLKQDFDTAEDLCRLFGNNSSKNLRKVVQLHTLGRLVLVANTHLENMRSRYRLRPLTDSLDICVLDHDMADTLRPTSSLSGGETFMVALSLALALSTLSAGSNDYSMLFIDEGFGALSPEALELVIDALEGLDQAYDKKVALISHTPAIRERIATHIEVSRQGEAGCSQLNVNTL